MVSAASTSFRSALSDVDNLLWFHGNEGGEAPGRRGAHFGSLNKSAMVLLCAAWETYIESVIQECADQNVDASASPGAMLRSLQKLVQSHVREGKNESTWQQIAGDGWRELTKTVVRSKVGALNTPKPGQVTDLMSSVLGVRDVTLTWAWHRNAVGEPARKLNEFVRLRGSIAHGERLPRSVTKANVTSAYDLLTRLVDAVEIRLAADGLL